jgi:hypothetical protein
MKKIGLVFLALVIGLAGVGAAMACWYGQLNINGTVNTATFGLCIDGSNVMQADQGADTISCVDFQSITKTENNFAETVITPPEKCGDTLSFVVNNGYGCYYNDISFHVNNPNSMPAQISSVALTFQGKTQTITSSGDILTWYNEAGAPIFQVKWGDNFGTCIGQNKNVEISFEFLLVQNIAEGQQYGFSAKINYVQCNCCDFICNKVA